MGLCLEIERIPNQRQINRLVRKEIYLTLDVIYSEVHKGEARNQTTIDEHMVKLAYLTNAGWYLEKVGL